MLRICRNMSSHIWTRSMRGTNSRVTKTWESAFHITEPSVLFKNSLDLPVMICRLYPNKRLSKNR